MVKKFISNLFLILLTNILIKPFWVFGIDRVVQNTVGTESYGLYYALFSLSYLPVILLDAGLNQYNNNTLSKNPSSASNMFSMLMPVKIFMMVFYLVIVVVLGLSKGFHWEEEKFQLLIILAINQALAWYILYMRSHFSGLHLFKTDIIFSVLDKSLMILFCSLLLYTEFFGTIDITKFAFAQMAAYLIAAIVSQIVLIPHIKPFKINIKSQQIKQIFIKGSPYALLTLFMAIYTRIDVVLLETIHPNGDTQAGIYAKCYRLLDAFNMVAVLAAGLLIPIFSRMLKQKQDLKYLVQTSFVVMILPASIASIYCMIYSEPIMNLLYHGNLDNNEIYVFIPVIACMIPMVINYIFGSLLTAAEEIRTLNWISFYAIILNLIGNLVFIPQYGALATGYVSLATQTLAVILSIYHCYHRLHIRLAWKILFKTLSITIVSLFILLILNYYQTSLLIGLIVSGIAGVFLVLFTRLIPMEQIKLLTSQIRKK